MKRITNHLLIITAGGQQTRWNGPHPKQLVPIMGEPLIHRLFSQFSLGASEVIVLSDNSEVCAACPGLCWFPEDPTMCDCVAETLCNTNPVWENHVVIVHGDVVFSNKQANRLMHFPYDVGFFGSWMELFALIFTPVERTNVLLDLAAAANEWRRGLGQGKLWNAYQVHNGIPVGEHQIANSQSFQNVWDWSRDLDSVEDYNKLLDDVRSGEIVID